MRINHNIQALNAYRNLNQTMNDTSKSLEKLSSGLRINRAADDAAGLAISEKMRSQIRGLEMAERNALDGVSLIQTAEGALASTHDILQRMRELAVQASNGTLEDSDREAVQDEIDALIEEVDRIAENTQFNSKELLNGVSGASGVTSLEVMLQIGANDGENIQISLDRMGANELNLSSGTGSGASNISLETTSGAQSAITTISEAIETVSKARSNLGAFQNRLEHTVSNLQSANENLTAAESRIRDLDMAKEMSQFTRNNILNQAGQAMLAQANQLPQGILQLLQ
ncbi:flagellin N-terminal helical domain-containing protein [Jeotgalibacillus terrae]|uniref:Flagellin n=1 Tax=Jeotgalibacillus terrae TaxID=587735 RepID=A0ABW5ZCD0_9BACL|nr:flagellin [Jeotgalibacillus terrae]MBM7577755.1 flagellin [Jeotgalibacillus terrae]